MIPHIVQYHEEVKKTEPPNLKSLPEGVQARSVTRVEMEDTSPELSQDGQTQTFGKEGGVE